MRDVPASGVYFCTYEWLKAVLTPAGKPKGNNLKIRFFFDLIINYL